MAISEAKSLIKKPKSKRWSKQRQNIISCAVKLFWQKGYDGTSVQDISDAAKVNKAAIYYYFENKSVLLYEISLQITEQLTNQAQEIINSNLSPEKKFEKLVKNQVIWALTHLYNTSAVLLERRNLPPKLLNVIIAKRSQYENIARDLLGELLPEEKAQIISPKIASLFIFGLIFSLTQWFKQSGEFSAEEIASKVYLFISDGLGLH
jgi:TetR/AcrR family transcriptional regulator, cholesterol catabolism regulator